MRFDFTPEEDTFRTELRTWLAEVLPAGWTGPADESDEDDWRLTLNIRRQLAEKGWLTQAWPPEYGGRGASHMMQAIFSEEMAWARAPGNDRFGTRMIGPTLIAFGTDRQKEQFLPGIARGETQWCQGYSEPNAGSDLASLQMRALDDGDDLIVNGSKIWTTLAHRADWMFLLVRTNPDAPRHRGISFIVCDMNTPGVAVRPIINMTGSHGFNEVIFSDARVPKSNVIGEIDGGWRVATALLDFERSGIDYAAGARRTLDELIEWARTPDQATGAVPAGDPVVRHGLARLDVQVEAARMIAWGVVWKQSRGDTSTAEASMSKITATRAAQDVAAAGVELLGMHGQLQPGSPHAVLEGRMLRLHLSLISATILAGTTEIQKNIIATRGLGLPRSA